MQESPEGTAAGVVIMKYNFKEIEKKWQDKWEEDGVFHAEDTALSSFLIPAAPACM